MSTKKRPGNDEVRGMLLEGHFGQAREFRSVDPIEPTHMHLAIDRIEPYEHNPRRQRNPMYSQIKASILAKRGLDDPIGITRRPGNASYTVRAGGNTRLSILKELWRETEDPAFSRAYCLFVPWTSESDCITAHLIENELRGELVFIDKAIALKGLLEKLEVEAGKALSRNEFLRRLAEIGYPVSKRQMIRYEYAAEVLGALLPEALESGLGGRQIDEIRNAEKRFCDYWVRCGLSPEAFDDLFRTTLSENDSDGWDLRTALDDLEARISERTGKPINRVRLELDASTAPLTVQPPTIEEAGPRFPSQPSPSQAGPEIPDDVMRTAAEKPEPAVGSEGEPKPAGRRGSISEGSRNTVRSLAPDAGTGSVSSEPERANAAPEDESAAGEEHSPRTASGFLSNDLNTARRKLSANSDLKSLRSRATVLATRFAQSFGCQHLIRPAPHGYGFFVEMPDRPIQAEDEVVRWGWWLLFSLSEQAITKARLKLAPHGMRLPALLIEDRLGEAFAATGQPPDAIHTLGYRFLSSPDLSERAFQDLLALIETCRILRKTVPEEKLWLCPTIAQLKKGERR